MHFELLNITTLLLEGSGFDPKFARVLGAWMHRWQHTQNLSFFNTNTSAFLEYCVFFCVHIVYIYLYNYYQFCDGSSHFPSPRILVSQPMTLVSPTTNNVAQPNNLLCPCKRKEIDFLSLSLISHSQFIQLGHICLEKMGRKVFILSEFVSPSLFSEQCVFG